MRIAFGPAACGLVLSMASQWAFADGTVIDRLYDPYVQPLEREIEFRMLAEHDDEIPDVQQHLLGLGQSLTDRVAVEIYAIGTTGRGDGYEIDASEIELKWQLTEQGEFSWDWGMLFELEREFEVNAWEASTSVLAAKDHGQWSTIVNLDLIYEWGNGIADEVDTTLHLQTRYRWREVFEPGVELHAGEDTRAIGPVFSGLYRVSAGKKFRWSLGLFAGLDDVSPESTVRLNLEYEF